MWMQKEEKKIKILLVTIILPDIVIAINSLRLMDYQLQLPTRQTFHSTVSFYFHWWRFLRPLMESLDI